MPSPPKQNTLVTLYVNTAFQGLSQANIIDHVWMGDSNGDIVNNNAGHVANYTTGVLSNGNITWVPATINIRTNPSDYVVITDIQISPGNANKVNVSPEPTPPAAGNTTHMNGKVNGSAGTPFEYTIVFTVYHLKDDGTWDEMEGLYVDPKIQIH